MVSRIPTNANTAAWKAVSQLVLRAMKYQIKKYQKLLFRKIDVMMQFFNALPSEQGLRKWLDHLTHLIMRYESTWEETKEIIELLIEFFKAQKYNEKP